MILHGDCLEQLKTMADNSVDAVVTDPPYGLRFMGKKWDYDVPSIDVWRECLRVLKPGGHMLVACGTRTQHRMVAPIEDAGFEIRDVITWLYGSGFPKSLDVSKAIDKAAGAEREVVGLRKYADGQEYQGGAASGRSSGVQGNKAERGPSYETSPATDAAKQWQGFGTALKPATEHFTIARKPLGETHSFWYETHKLCQLLLSAYLAESPFQLNRLAHSGDLNTVPCSAEESISTLADLCAQMDTLQFESVPTSSLSIASLWHAILGALLKHANTSTIETVSSLTTDLKTLNSLLSRITQGSTDQGETQISGYGSSACIVESGLKSVLYRLAFILSTGAEYAALNDTASLTDKLKPNSEFWTLCRKPLEGTVAANVLKWGVGGLNIDGTRIAHNEECRMMAAQTDDEVMTGRGKYGQAGRRQETLELKPNGRFPANLILGHSPHCTDDQCDIECAIQQLDAQSGPIKTKLPFKKLKETDSRGMYGAGVGAAGQKFESQAGLGITVSGASRFFFKAGLEPGEASRFLYCPKVSASERNAGLEGMPEKPAPKFDGGDFQRGNGNNAKDQVAKNHHPTVKPLKLMRYLCKLITPPNGLVLDPFAGSGSTGVAALQEGFRFIGIEREAEYVAIAQKRIESCTMIKTS